MDVLRMEQNDKQVARLLGIRAKQAGLAADSMLASLEMQDLCKGRDHRGVKMLTWSWLRGWEVQHKIQVTFGKRGTATFTTQEEAESYLMKMPVNYAGATRKQESGKWAVSYRRISTTTKLDVGAATLRRMA